MAWIPHDGLHTLPLFDLPVDTKPALELRLPGKPRGQGSIRMITRKGGKGTYAKYSDPVVDHRNRLIELARDVWGNWTQDPLPAARIAMDFVVGRPANHYLPANTRRPVRQLREEAPTHHLSPPDLDKLQRLILDGLKIAGVLSDDAVVVDIVAGKRWSDPDPEGSHIRVYPA